MEDEHEVFFSSFPGGCLWENNTASSSCALARRDSEGFVFLSMRCWESAGLRTAVKFVSWQRKKREKVLIKVMNFMGPLLWPTTYTTYGRPSKPCNSSGEQIYPPCVPSQPHFCRIQIIPSPFQNPCRAGDSRGGFFLPVLGGMSCFDNLGCSKIPRKARAESYWPAHGTCTEQLEGTFSARANFLGGQRGKFLCEGRIKNNNSSAP